MSKFINISNTRSEEQRRVMQEIHKNDHCPFCAENIAKYHKNPILKDGKYWILTDNQWPYKNTKHQLLAIHKTHIEHINELEPEAAAELITFFKEESIKRNIKGGAIMIRFGSNPEKGSYGSTVLHIHAHLIEPNLDALSETESFKVKIGQSKDYVGGV